MSGIVKKSGHAVTNVLPPHSDGVQVAPANINFPDHPSNISSGAGKSVSGGNAYAGGSTMASKKKSGFPPAK